MMEERTEPEKLSFGSLPHPPHTGETETERQRRDIHVALGTMISIFNVAHVGIDKL